MMKVIVDRIIDDKLVLEIEQGKVITVPKELIPTASEGDVINITVDKEETEIRREKIKNLMDNLFS